MKLKTIKLSKYCIAILPVVTGEDDELKINFFETVLGWNENLLKAEIDAIKSKMHNC